MEHVAQTGEACVRICIRAPHLVLVCCFHPQLLHKVLNRPQVILNDCHMQGCVASLVTANRELGPDGLHQVACNAHGLSHPGGHLPRSRAIRSFLSDRAWPRGAAAYCRAVARSRSPANRHPMCAYTRANNTHLV